MVQRMKYCLFKYLLPWVKGDVSVGTNQNVYKYQDVFFFLNMHGTQIKSRLYAITDPELC